MNGKDIFLGLRYVGEDLIEQAEFGTFASGSRKKMRPLLMAALIALLLMLVGCAVAYVVRIQSMKIANITESQPIFSENYLDIKGYQDVEMQVLTLAGLKGSPNYMAAQEWYEFKEAYDPEMQKYLELYQAGAFAEVPQEFSGIQIYTQEMMEAMQDILNKYQLLPPGELLQFRTLKTMCKALGIEKIQTAQNAVGIQIDHGSCYSNGNFLLTMRFALPVDGKGEIYDTWANLYWCRKDCFTSEYTTIADTNDWKEWNYTTAAGSEVLIFRSPSDSRGWIVCQREEAQMVLQLEVRRDQQNGYKMLHQYLTDRQIETIADAIDFSVQPNKVTREAVQNQAPYLPGTAQNGWNVELKQVQTDGFMLQILLGITAPEDMDITHAESDNVRYPYFDISPGNRLEYFVPVTGEKNGYSWSWYPEEDGDGLSNTAQIRMTYYADMMDHSAPFADGAVWNLQIEDLLHEYWDSQRDDIVLSVLTEGEWNFTIQFGKENGDYEKLEMLTEPMPLPVTTGWDEFGNDIRTTNEVTSIEIHPMSVHFLSESGEMDYGWVNVVMKDGTRIPASPVNYGKRSVHEATKWIDLHEVAYLLLQDGTIIPVPGTTLPKVGG